MLHQNWFMSPRFEMYEDYGESQSFFDTETEMIYVVFEEYGMSGNTIVQEIAPDSSEYAMNLARYKQWKNTRFNVSIEFSIYAKDYNDAEMELDELIGDLKEKLKSKGKEHSVHIKRV